MKPFDKQDARAWHAEPADVVLAALTTSERGLAVDEVTRRQQAYGPNVLPEKGPSPLWRIVSRQFAASFHLEGARTDVFVKGAPERVLDMCGDQLSADDRTRLNQLALGMAARGLRVLAVGHGQLSSPLQREDVPPQPANLTHLGFLGMIDPLRAGAGEAVADCHRAGVLVSMVTGDHRVTALAIARDLGLADRDEQVVTAADIEGRSAEQLGEMVQRIRVFARVTPRQKLQIVDAARKAGHFVAVTGDGVNDATTLRAANIGVAMGKAGTDVAREAADLVISDDNFSSIVGGIEEGRIAYDNIRKVIYLLVSTMVLFENFHIGNCRSETKSAFALSPFRSPVLLFGTLGAFLIHVTAMYVPFLQDMLSTTPVGLSLWGVAIGVSILIVPAVELHKWWWAKRTSGVLI